MGNGILQLGLWELEPPGGYVGLSEFAHQPGVTQYWEVDKNGNENYKISKMVEQ